LPISGAQSDPVGGHPPVSPALRAALVLVAALTLVPVWIAPYPPGYDVPQHAAQVGVAVHRADPSWPHDEVFRFNPLTPHVIGFAATCALSWALPIPVAFKVVLSVSLLALPLATRRLLRGQRYDPWWLLLTLPIGLGYAFRWGFVHYLLATPIVLWFTAVALHHARRPEPRRAAGLAALALLLVFTHLIAVAAATLIGGALVLASARSVRDLVVRLLPLAVAPPIAVAWLLLNREAAATGVETVFRLGWHRLAQLPAWLVGKPVTTAAVLTGLAFLLLPFAAGGRFARSLPRLLPLVCVLALHFLAPADLFGTAALYPRFAVFVLPFLLLALDAGPARRPFLGAALPLLLSVLWVTTIGLELLNYRREMVDLRALIGRMEPERRLLYFPLDRADPAAPGAVYLHSGMWYQAEGRGIVDFSFAEFFANPFRYAPGREPPLPEDFEWFPTRFRWREHGGERFDCFLVRAPVDLGAMLLAGAPAPPRLELRAGDWWLYSTAPGGDAVCTPGDRPSPGRG
jgi:hypothetical protein